jgi:hypothetical protein
MTTLRVLAAACSLQRHAEEAPDQETGTIAMLLRNVSAAGLTASLLMLAGCAGTPYQAYGGRGGYQEKQLREDVLRVTFQGNGFTTQETVQTFWLYRAAELTLQKGYEGFEVLSDLRFVSTDPAYATADGALIRTGAAPIFIPMPSSGRPHPKLEGDIRLLKRPFTPSPPRVFDARALKATLEPHVTKSCGSMMSEREASNNVCAHVHDYLFPKKP